MRSKALAVVFILSLCFGTVPTPVEAAPTGEIFTDYYDCALNHVGSRFRGCGSWGSNWGQQSGHFKLVESCACEFAYCTFTWYVWNGTGWTRLPGEPTPAC